MTLPFVKIKLAYRSTDWFFTPFLLMLVTYLLWFYFIRPIESWIFSSDPRIVSIFFLPHFARILGTWFFGYPAFFGILAGHIAGVWITKGFNAFDLWIAQIAFIGALSAALAVWVLDIAQLQKPASTASHAPNWRGILFLGFLASIFNAVGSVILRYDEMESEEIENLFATYLIGDTGSVFVGLLILMFVVRISRKMKAPQ